MRISASPRTGLPVARILGAALLASVAAGCSSDATRFSALLGDNDSLTTNSVPRRPITGLNGEVPVPVNAVASGQGGRQIAAAQQDYSNRRQALSQPMPGRAAGYDPIRTSTADPSAARLATTPVSVQRSELSAPSLPATTGPSSRSQALAQPFPAAPAAQSPVVNAAQPPRGPLTTASVPPGSSRVTLARGETITTLSRRYGVSEQAILKANGLSSGAEAATGQSVIIPSTTAPSVAQNSAAPGALAPAGNIPIPRQAPDQRVAVLPNNGNGARDKQQPEPATKPAPSAGKAIGATYVVKPGDTLTKIARETGTPVNALKQANGLSAQQIRVGQVLKLPGGTRTVASAGDNLTTGSTPPQPKAETSKPQQAAAPQPARDSVSEVASAPAREQAPEATGIGKYRWPARGAVIAGYGENVEGKRNDGIDISVPQGTPVKAAENGVVIYAGNGLKELGNTVLVRHEDGTVTVYGHADSLAVTRGQKVQRGQQLATSGMSGSAKRPMLHFEVRKDATPVNPMGFLE